MKFVYFIACLLSIGCSNLKTKTNKAGPSGTTTTTATTSTSENQPDENGTTKFVNKVLKAKSLEEALNLCSPYMGNKQDEDDVGTLCLAGWGMSHFSWNMVHVVSDETTPGLVFKDYSTQLGKRICSTGTVVEIHSMGRGVPGMDYGELFGFSGTIYHFITVKGSGNIVGGSTATLCGYVSGVYSYTNSVGGISHSVDIAGMWDPSSKHQ